MNSYNVAMRNAILKEYVDGCGEEWELKAANLFANTTNVFIHYNNEAGPWQWSTSSTLDPGNWLFSSETEDEAVELCRLFGWKIDRITVDKNG